MAPARITASPAGLGSIPEACAGTDTSIQGFASALIAVDDFYGHLHAGVAPRFRRRLGREDWVSVWLPALEYRFGANATVEASSTDVGPAALGYHRSFSIARRARVAPYLRVLHPLDSIYTYAVRYGFDHGASLLFDAEAWLSFSGGFSFPTFLTLNGSNVLVTYIPSFVAEVALSPLSWVRLNTGLGLRWRGGDDYGFEALDPRMAVSLYPYRGTRVELGALLPVWGEDRTDWVVGLNVGWIFGVSSR